MSDYLLLFQGGSTPESEEEQKQAMDAWTSWFTSLGSSVKDSGNPTSGQAKTIAVDGAVSDGAAVNASGYSILTRRLARRGRGARQELPRHRERLDHHRPRGLRDHVTPAGCGPGLAPGPPATVTRWACSVIASREGWRRSSRHGRTVARPRCGRSPPNAQRDHHDDEHRDARNVSGDADDAVQTRIQERVRIPVHDRPADHGHDGPDQGGRPATRWPVASGSGRPAGRPTNRARSRSASPGAAPRSPTGSGGRRPIPTAAARRRHRWSPAPRPRRRGPPRFGGSGPARAALRGTGRPPPPRCCSRS